MQWWYSIAFQHLAWLLHLVYLQWANPQTYKWNWIPWGFVCVIFFFFNERCWMCWKQLAVPIDWGGTQRFYLLSRCERLAASMASGVLVNWHPSLSVMNATAEKASLHAKLESTAAWSLCWCSWYHKADFPGESWTSSKKSFNNTGNGRKGKK